MYELTDITATFQKVSNTFSPISSNPSDGDLQRLNEVLVVCCLSVTFSWTADGIPSGVVLPNSVYKANHRGASFKFMRDPRADYDTTIKTSRRMTAFR